MRSRLSAGAPLAIVVLAAVAVAALRPGARRPEPREVPGTEPPPVTATAEVGQMQYVFHELHADGHHALCEVCASQNQQ